MKKIQSETRIFRPAKLSGDKAIQGHNCFLKKLMVHNNPDIDLVSDNEYKNLV